MLHENAAENKLHFMIYNLKQFYHSATEPSS